METEERGYIDLPDAVHAVFRLEVSACDSDGDMEFEICTGEVDRDLQVYLAPKQQRELLVWLQKHVVPV